jgi:hypothetical protein
MSGTFSRTWILLAERTHVREWARALRNRSSQVDTQYVLTGLGVLAVIVVALWGVSYFLSRRERRRSYDSALMLFLALCKAHRLGWSDRWLLWRVARRQRLRDPARLFLEPRRLAAENLCPSLRTREPQLQALRARLYTGLETPPVPAPQGVEDPQAQVSAEPAPAALPKRPPLPDFPTAASPALDLPPWTAGGDAAGSRQ